MTSIQNHKHTSMPSLREREAHREWIGGRALTLLSHYWRENDPAPLTAAIGADWATVLEGLPRNAIQMACIEYQRSEPRRKPTPGAIYQLAMKYVPKPQLVARNEPRPEPQRERVSQERAAEILAEAGFAPKKFGE